MTLIHNDVLLADPWHGVDDGADIPATGPVIVSLSRFLAERDRLAGRNGPLGVRLASDEGPEALAGDLSRLALIALTFPAFTDGRAYSTARLLRERFGFAGELRAVGQVLPDQLPFMRRCGIDAFDIPDTVRRETALATLGEGGAGPWYQASTDGAPTVLTLRRPSGGGGGTGAGATPAAVLAADLEEHFGGLPAEDLIAQVVVKEFRGRIAYVSSFGTEAAVLLHMVATVDPATPVLFVDSGRLFPETIAYRNDLAARLGLVDVRTVRPDPAALAGVDALGGLCRDDPDLCCRVRKVEPLARAMVGLDAWINGRKSHHGGARAVLPAFEAGGDGRVRITPLRDWAPAEIDAYFEIHDLPRHPLERLGYASVGCAPCTDPVQPGEAVRAGRWRGRTKTECGIHLPPPPRGLS